MNLQNIQIEIIKLIQSVKNPILDILFLAFTISTEVPIIVGFAALMYWCINKTYGQKLLFTLIGNITINTGIKETIKSPRPIGVEGIESMRTETAGGYSFPSGHTQTATTFWTSLMLIFKKRWIYIIGTIIILGVGISRMYLGVHWPVDIIGGWFLGILCTMILLKIFDITKKSKSYLPLILTLIPFALYTYILNSESYIKMFGLLSGFILGYIVEDKFIKFDTMNNYTKRISFKEKDKNIQRKIKRNIFYRFMLGITTLGVVYLGLKYIMPKDIIYDYLRYLLIVFYAMAGAPALFKLFKLV